MDPASLPEDGSVKQNAAKSFPVVTRGKYFAFCSGVPNNNIPCKDILKIINLQKQVNGNCSTEEKE